MSGQPERRVLVTDAHTTSALAIVRSLSGAGMRVTVVAGAGRFSLAAHSKHADRVCTLPAVDRHPRAYLDELIREVENGRYDVLIPTTDSTIAVIMAERERIERAVAIALPPNPPLQAARDKQKTIEHATGAAVAVPRTWVCSSLDQLDTLSRALEYPCVVKPRFSRHWSGTGPLIRGTVTYADSPASLRQIVRSSPFTPEALLVQELVPGVGIGVFALMHEGEARVVFAHRRLREANPTGGRASLAESIPPDDRLIAPAIRLLRSVGWTGVAMVEFKDPGPPASPVAMEVNGRFWGSLPLAIESGIDFPVLLVQQVLGLTVTAPAGYAVGVKCRHLSGDLSHLAASLKGRPRWWRGPFPTPFEALTAITPWPGRWRPFNMWASDPMPGLREAGHFVRQAAQRLSPTRGQTLKGAATEAMKIDCLAHVHSSFSYDSQTDLADVARTARRHGIRCVLMSEHNNRLDPDQVSRFVARCDELSDDTLLIIPGLELAFDSNRVHLLAYGIRRFIDSSCRTCTFTGLIDAIHEAGGLAVLAHPTHRHAVQRLTADDLDRLDGIEVWNVKNGNRYVPNVSDLSLHRAVRQRGGRPFAFGGLDWHHMNRFSRFTLEVHTAALTQTAIFEALVTGRFAVRGRYVSVPPTGEPQQLRILTYGAISAAVARARRIAYRCQSMIERRGMRLPRTLSAVARRVF